MSHLQTKTDESLLCQGLALNDDLQRLLAKHQALGSTEPGKPKPESTQGLVDVEAALVDTGESSTKADGRASSAVGQPSKAPPPASNHSTSTSKDLAKIDLLSGDLLSGEDLGALEPQSSLALVPVSVLQPSSPVASNQNALAVVDMFSVGTSAPTSLNAQQEFQQQQQQFIHSPHSSPCQNGFATNMGFLYEQTGYQQPSSPSWNTHIIQQQQQPASPVYSVQQPSSPSYGPQNGGALPPPPWESQPDSPQFASQYPGQMQVATMGSPQSPKLGPQMMGGNQQVVGMYMQPITAAQLSMINNIQANQMSGMYPQSIQGGQMMGMLPQAMQMQMQMQAGQAAPHSSQIYGNQMAGYGGGYGYGHGYAQQQDTQLLENRMYALSVRDDSALRNN